MFILHVVIANYQDFNGMGFVCLFVFPLCCHFANGYKLSSLEADPLHVKTTSMKEKKCLLSILPFFVKLYIFFETAEINAKFT